MPSTACNNVIACTKLRAIPGNTATHLAVRLAAERPQILERLMVLEDGYDLVYNNDGLAPQHLAARLHSLPALEILLRSVTSDRYTEQPQTVTPGFAHSYWEGSGTIHCAAGTVCAVIPARNSRLHMFVVNC